MPFVIQLALLVKCLEQSISPLVEETAMAIGMLDPWEELLMPSIEVISRMLAIKESVTISKKETMD